MRHDPGLAASPPVRYILELERSVYSSFHLPSAVDGHPAREAAAYGGTQTARNTSAPPSKLITLLKPLICFRVPTRLAKQSMCVTHCRQDRVGQRRNRPRLRGIRLTYAEYGRVTEGARTRDLRSHKSNEACPARPSVSVKVLICRYFVRREIQYRPLHTNSYQPGCSTSTGFSLCWDAAVSGGQGVYEAGVGTHSSAPRSPV